MGKKEDAKRKAAEKRKKREMEIKKQKTKVVAAAAKPAENTLTINDLEIVECVISEGWQERGLAHILLARRLPNNALIVGGWYVDTFCLGIKDTAVIEEVTEEDYRSRVKDMIFNDPVTLVDVSPQTAMAVVVGAADYADKFGFKPNKRFSMTVKMFGDVVPDYTGVEFGRGGKPCYIQRNESNAQAIIARLQRIAGPDNYIIEKEEK